nr:ATP synthase subunit 8 [Actornithophilus grandiceps]
MPQIFPSSICFSFLVFSLVFISFLIKTYWLSLEDHPSPSSEESHEMKLQIKW